MDLCRRSRLGWLNRWVGLCVQRWKADLSRRLMGRSPRTMTWSCAYAGCPRAIVHGSHESSLRLPVPASFPSPDMNRAIIRLSLGKKGCMVRLLGRRPLGGIPAMTKQQWRNRPWPGERAENRLVASCRTRSALDGVLRAIRETKRKGGFGGSGLASDHERGCPHLEFS